jgi:hypothetical protein
VLALRFSTLETSGARGLDLELLEAEEFSGEETRLDEPDEESSV